MPSLKALKNRIKSVKSTQKITKAMKMVAAAKLRRAKEAAEAARPYAKALEGMLGNLAGGTSGGLPLLTGTGKEQVHLLLVATSDRGLCGAFNSSIVRATRRKVRELQAQGKTVKIYCVGRKGAETLNTEFGKLFVARQTDVGRRKLAYRDAESVAADLIARFEAKEFDVATVVYNHFKSAISQIVTWQQLVPLPVEVKEKAAAAPYEYEPSAEAVLADLLPRNIGVQIYKALLENAASEQGARMTAMDNATRNAGDMIKRLNLVYNRTRQAAITKELIEIISGAEAV